MDLAQMASLQIASSLSSITDLPSKMVYIDPPLSLLFQSLEIRTLYVEMAYRKHENHVMMVETMVKMVIVALIVSISVKSDQVIHPSEETQSMEETTLLALL